MERSIFEAHRLRRLLRRAYPLMLQLPGNEALLCEIERELEDPAGVLPSADRLTLEALPQKLSEHGVACHTLPGAPCNRA